MTQRNRNGCGLIVGAALVCLLAAPGIGNAQQVGGSVTDTTGGVLPGVTVAARSPVLIEQVRTAVTDGAGQYLIVALEPGTYSVTYTLPGFTTFVREGIEISTGFTATIHVELPVGDVQETITVSGASPVVDIQSVALRAVMDREVIDSIPTGKSLISYGLLIPGMTGSNSFGSSLTQDAGGLSLQTLGTMSIHGGSQSDQMTVINGMDVGDTFLQGASRAYFPDTSFDEVSFSYSANSAEIETGGVAIGLIPRDGGNSFSGSVFSTFGLQGLMADNLDQDLIDRGLENAHKLEKNWTFAPSFGGPIVEDRVWFFLTHSSQVADLQSPGVFFSVDATSLRLEKDLTRPSPAESASREQSINLTFQLTPKDKVKGYWTNSSTDKPHQLQGRALGSVFLQPEAAYRAEARTNVYQVNWTRPHSNRLLFEAGYSHLPTRSYNGVTAEALATGSAFLPGILEVSPLTGLRNASSFLTTTRNSPKRVNFYKGSMSYVTGSHNLKVGFTFQQQGTFIQSGSLGDWYSMRTLLGRPFTAIFRGQTDQTDKSNTLGIYAQDQWTLDRLTLRVGVRLDYINSYYPDQERPTNIWITAPFSVPGMTVTTWKDIQPRLGLAYDLTGDGKTALKVSASRYGKRNSTGLSRDVNPVANNLTLARSWYDGATGHPFLRIPFGTYPSCIGAVACIPGDGLVQGDPTNPAPNGELVTSSSNLAFGIPMITDFFDPAWAFGWGQREANWEFSASVQRELGPGLSLDVAFFRRAWINPSTTDNRAVGPDDYVVGTVTVPTDSRLPGGGGGTLSFFDLTPGSVRVADNIRTLSGNFASESEMWNGFDITVDARVNDILLQGGLSTGRTSRDFCDRQSALPERSTGSALDFCDRSQNWLTSVKLLGSYVLPYDIQIAATLQNQPGPSRQALQQFGASQTDLGRPFVAYQSTVELNLIEPGSSYGERFSQVDLRLTKLIDLGGTAQLRAMFDMFNLLNANAVTIEEPSFGDNWLDPINIMPGRLAKFAFQIDF